MRIVYVLPSFSGDFTKPNGGVESATFNLIEGLQQVDGKIEIFLIYPNKNQKIKDLKGKIIPVPINSYFRLTWTYNYPIIGINKKIEKKIQSINPDIVHVHGAPGFYRHFDKGKTILTVHGMPYIEPRKKNNLVSLLKWFFLIWLFPRDINRYRNIIFQVNFAYKKYLNYLYNDSNIYFISNSVAQSSEFVEPPIIDKPVFIFSGILRPLKNIDGILLAASLLKQQGCDFYIKLTGYFASEDYEITIRQKTKQLNLSDNIIFLGDLNLADRNKVLSSCHVNLLPSFQEVSPMSIIEAMVFGIPTISSNVGGIPELIKNGVNGIVMANNNPNELAKQMRYLIDKPEIYKIMSRNCIDNAKLYSSSFIAKQTLEVYLSCLYDNGKTNY